MSTSEKTQNIPLLNSTLSNEDVWVYNLYESFFKRGIDLILCLLFLPITVPILIILMALVKLDSRGPTIYKSERIGKNGIKFKCFKLRTMCINAEERLKNILNRNEELREEWQKDHKLKNDPRITKLGRLIRSLSLDEIPQIFNVLRGEMSFVGPRPIVEDEVVKYGNNFRYYTSVRPGITGLWQINGRNDISYGERVQMDNQYVLSNNLFLDLKILLKTVPAALSKKGAY